MMREPLPQVLGLAAREAFDPKLQPPLHEALPPAAPTRPALTDRLVALGSNALHSFAAAVLLTGLALVVAGDVFARYFAKSPIDGAQDISTLCLLMLFMAALPACTLAGGHVKVETLYERMGPRMRAAADALSHLAGALFVGTVAFWQFREIPGMIRRADAADVLPIPLWPVAGFVGLCAAATLLVLARGMWVALRALFGNEERVC